VEDALILQVLLYLSLDRSQTGKDITVRVNDAFGIGGGAGGEDDLGGIGFAKIFDGRRLVQRERLEIFECDGVFECAEELAAACNQFGINLLGYAKGKGLGTLDIDRNRENSAHDAAEECGDPRCSIVSPDEDPVAFLDVTGFEFRGEAAGLFGEAFIGAGFLAETVAADNRDLIAVAVEILNQGC
jgi:hypothetical protein